MFRPTVRHAYVHCWQSEIRLLQTSVERWLEDAPICRRSRVPGGVKQDTSPHHKRDSQGVANHSVYSALSDPNRNVRGWLDGCLQSPEGPECPSR